MRRRENLADLTGCTRVLLISMADAWLENLNKGQNCYRPLSWAVKRRSNYPGPSWSNVSSCVRAKRTVEKVYTKCSIIPPDIPSTPPTKHHDVELIQLGTGISTVSRKERFHLSKYKGIKPVRVHEWRRGGCLVRKNRTDPHWSQTSVEIDISSALTTSLSRQLFHLLSQRPCRDRCSIYSRNVLPQMVARPFDSFTRSGAANFSS